MFSPNNMPQLSAYLTVKDADKSIDFYSQAFGFVIDEVSNDEKGVPQHVSMKKEDAVIMFAPEGAWGSTKKTPANLNVSCPMSLYIYCEDVDKLYKQAISYGAKSVTEPNDSFWGDRFCAVMDMDGYEWWFATVLKK